MKKVLMIMIIAAIGLTGCEIEQSAETIQRKKTDQAMKEADSQIGMPAIKNFQERKLAKYIFELRDKENLTTYAYLINKMTGKLVFFGKCIGYGLPYSVQYTNPMKRLRGNSATVPQADPNGLYMPQGLSATWLLMVDPKTKQARPVYVEPEIVVSPFKLH